MHITQSYGSVASPSARMTRIVQVQINRVVCIAVKCVCGRWSFAMERESTNKYSKILIIICER